MKEELKGITRNDAVNTNSKFGVKGWLFIISILMCCWVAGAAGTDGLNTILTQFVDKFGWSRATLTVASTCAGFFGAVTTSVMGLVAAKIGPKKTMIIIMSIITAAIFCWGYVESIVAYMICVLFIDGFFYGVVLCMGILASNWFPKKRGLVIGWITMGFNISTISANWILTFGWSHFGFHGGFNLLGLLGVCAIIMLILFVKNNPEEAGFFPDNDKTMTMEKALQLHEEGEKYLQSSPWTFRKLIRNKNVWLIGIVYGFIQMMTVGCVSQLVPSIVARGYSQPTAMLCLSIAGVLGLFGSWFVGFLDVKHNTKFATRFMILWILATAVIFSLPVGSGIVFVACVMLGMVLGGTNNLCSSMTTHVFGRYDQQKAYSVVIPIYTFVRALGYGLVGVLAEKTGTYTVPWLFMAGLNVVGFFMLYMISSKCIGRESAN